MILLDSRTRATGQFVHCTSQDSAPKYFFFNDQVNIADEARERARLRVAFEKKVDQLFLGQPKPIQVIELD